MFQYIFYCAICQVSRTKCATFNFTFRKSALKTSEKYRIIMYRCIKNSSALGNL